MTFAKNPPPVAVDSNCLAYLTYAIRPSYSPTADTSNLLKERISMVRILLYIGNLAILPSVEKEYQEIKEICGLAEAVCQHIDVDINKPIYDFAFHAHPKEMDCRIFTEAVTAGLKVLLTCDDKFTERLKSNPYGLTIELPSTYWQKSGVQKGASPRILPDPSNHLSWNRFWEV
jgi:hypothetical protein